MIKYTLRRVLLVIPVMLILSFLVFSMFNFLPSNAAVIAAGEHAIPEVIEYYRDLMGLNYSFFERYFRWLSNFIFNQHLGYSLMGRFPIFPVVLMALSTSFRIVFIAMPISLIIGIPVGIVSAVKQYSFFDRVGMVLTVIMASMPSFWQAMLLNLLIIHLVRNGFLSIEIFIGGNNPFFLVLSAVILGLSFTAIIARMTRSSILEEIYQDYIRTPRAFGQTERVVILKHALKNALIPIITTMGLNFGLLLVGSIYFEIVFRLNGTGLLLLSAIRSRDYPILMGIIMMYGLIFSILNLIIDLLYAYIDPRIRTQYK